MTTSKPYVLGADAVEAHRLMLQHRLWGDVAHAQWLRAGFAPGDRILDLGAGPGYASRDLAQLLGPTGEVVALEAAADYLKFLHQIPQDPGSAKITPIAGDAHGLRDAKSSPIASESIDAAYIRWVLHFTPRPHDILKGIHRVLTPGSPLAIQDYCDWASLFWTPAGEGLHILRRCVLSSYAAVGANPEVGKVLPKLLEDAGFEVVEIRPLVRIAQPGDPLWHWPDAYFKSYLPRMVDAGHMTRDEMATVLRDWQDAGDADHAYFMSPSQVEILAVKA